MLGVLIVVFCPDCVAALSFSLSKRQIPLIVSLRVVRALCSGRGAFDDHRVERAANDAVRPGWRVFMLVFRPFCMAHSLVVPDENAPRGARWTKNQIWWRAFSEECADALLKPPCLLCTAFIDPYYGRDSHRRPGNEIKPFEEMLTISEADRFSRRGGTYRLHAIHMNQGIHMEKREKLSSTPLQSEATKKRIRQ